MAWPACAGSGARLGPACIGISPPPGPNRPGVLAHVFGVLAGAEIHVAEVENIIYHGAQATLARIHLDGAPGNGALERIKSGNADIISVELSEIDGRR